KELNLMEEIHRKDATGDIIVNPEGFEEMKKKYQKREEEQIKQLFARQKAETQKELEDLAANAIVKRALRASSEHKALPNKAIIKDAKSAEILALREQLNEEIKAIGRRIFQEPSEKTEEKKPPDLRERHISPTSHKPHPKKESE